MDNAEKPTYRIGAAGGFEVPMADLAANKLDAAAEQPTPADLAPAEPDSYLADIESLRDICSINC
jgi:hypothetical protein